jgi:hypothetical protein
VNEVAPGSLHRRVVAVALRFPSVSSTHRFPADRMSRSHGLWRSQSGCTKALNYTVHYCSALFRREILIGGGGTVNLASPLATGLLTCFPVLRAGQAKHVQAWSGGPADRMMRLRSLTATALCWSRLVAPALISLGNSCSLRET